MSYLFENHKDRIVSVNANVKIINRRGQINILCHKLPLMRYYEKDLVSQKVAIIQLYRTRLAEQKQLARAFGIHPNTVNNLIRSYHKIKNLSFLQKKRGPKDNYFLTPRVQRVIYEEVFLSQGKLSEKELYFEVLVVKGRADKIKIVADELISTRGVKHGKLT